MYDLFFAIISDPVNAARGVFQGSSTLVEVIKYLSAYQAFSYAVWTLCFVMSSVKKVGYVAKYPRTAASVALVLSLAAAKYGAITLPENPFTYKF